MDSLLLSIIVPAYNVEQYIEKCLRSILNQTYSNIEIIVVDDGSIDDTRELCNRLAEKDARLNVISQCNAGQMSARKKGLQYASGELVGFVDADDWIENDYFENLVVQMADNDMIAVAAIRDYKDGEKKEFNNYPSNIYKTKDELSYLYEGMLCFSEDFEFGILPYMWNKLFRRSLLNDVLKSIDNKIYDGEDAAVVLAYVLKANSIVLSDYGGYHYVHRDGSVTNRKVRDNYYNEVCLYKTLYEIFIKNEFKDTLISQLNKYILMMIWKRNPEQYIKANKFIFPYSKIKRNERIIIYGAGDVGKSYRQQILQSDYCKLVGVADKKFDNYESDGWISPNKIVNIAFDHIVIAIADKRVANAIKDQLLSLHIPSQKIIVNNKD